jgi:hypothetical protein
MAESLIASAGNPVVGAIIWIIFIAILLGFVALAVYMIKTEGLRGAYAQTMANGRRKAAKRVAKKQGAGMPISQVGAQPTSGLGCPKCGGTSFQARRSTAARAGVVMTGVAGAAVTKRKETTCQTCGSVYKRG